MINFEHFFLISSTLISHVFGILTYSDMYTLNMDICENWQKKFRKWKRSDMRTEEHLRVLLHFASNRLLRCKWELITKILCVFNFKMRKVFIYTRILDFSMIFMFSSSYNDDKASYEYAWCGISNSWCGEEDYSSEWASASSMSFDVRKRDCWMSRYFPWGCHLSTILIRIVVIAHAQDKQTHKIPKILSHRRTEWCLL